MKKKSLLSVREEELMNYLWRYDEALTSNEMAKQPELQGWNRATLLKTVQSLTDAGYLEVAGLEKSVKAYARKLVPSLTKEDSGKVFHTAESIFQYKKISSQQSSGTEREKPAGTYDWKGIS